MSDWTYSDHAEQRQKDLVWLRRKITTPPFTTEAREETGFLLRELQKGIPLALPHSRPMPSIGVRCHELRITDRACIWRIIYRVEPDAIVILDVFPKNLHLTG